MHCKNAVPGYTHELQILQVWKSRICIEKSLHTFCLCINVRIANLTRMTEIWEPVWETRAVIVFFFWVDPYEMVVCTHALLCSKGMLFERDGSRIYITRRILNFLI